MTNYEELARREMDASGLPDDVVLTRALLVGIVIRPHNERGPDGEHLKFIAYVPEDFKQPAEHQSTVGFFGTDEYTLSWRWLKACYPEALQNGNI